MYTCIPCCSRVFELACILRGKPRNYFALKLSACFTSVFKIFSVSSTAFTDPLLGEFDEIQFYEWYIPQANISLNSSHSGSINDTCCWYTIQHTCTRQYCCVLCGRITYLWYYCTSLDWFYWCKLFLHFATTFSRVPPVIVLAQQN